MSEGAAIEVRGLHHRYGDLDALHDVSLTIGRGEMFGMLGPNGGGKSTLFRILATLQRPTDGRASILGHDVVEAPSEVRRHIGVVFQHPSLDGKLTVRENLVHHGALFGMARADLRDGLRAEMKKYLEK